MASYGNITNADHIAYARGRGRPRPRPRPHPRRIFSDTNDRMHAGFGYPKERNSQSYVIHGQSKGNNVYGDISPPSRDRYYYNTSDHGDDEDDGIECIDGLRFRPQKGAFSYTDLVETPPRKEPTSCADNKDKHEVGNGYSPPSYIVPAGKDKNASPNYEPVNNYPTIDSKNAAAKYHGVLLFN